MSAKIFSHAGFRVVYSGDGVTAWSKEIAGKTIIVTDSAGTSHELAPFHAADTKKPDAWLIGVHEFFDGSKNALEYAEATTAEEAIRTAERLAERWQNRAKN